MNDENSADRCVSKESFDFVVVGAGIAGAGVAAELAPHGAVLLVEREEMPGYHTTGRSAAVFAESYGPPAVRALTRASAAFFERPAYGFSQAPLVSPRGILFLARFDQADALRALEQELANGGRISRLDANAVMTRMPLVRPDYVRSGLFDDSGRDIDVAALHQGYLRQFRAAGGVLLTGADVSGLAGTRSEWTVETSRGTFRAGSIVNAAGAWADEVARLAGAMPLGLVPKRRTALIVAAPPGVDPAPWPIAIDVEEEFYLKPEAGRLLISPADETPSAPCDTQPEDIDVAIGVDRIEKAFDISVTRIERKWAGLRSFFQDKCPACGFDGAKENFFWLAGQGGYGIQTAPALSQLAAALVLGRPVPGHIEEQGVSIADVAPSRLLR